MTFYALQEYELTLTWEDFVEKIIKKFGKPEIETGWKKFDNRYLIKSNRAEITKTILEKEIQEVLLKHNVYSISYQTDKSKEQAELTSVIQRSAGTKEMNIELIQMFKKLIDNLEKTRVISSRG